MTRPTLFERMSAMSRAMDPKDEAAAQAVLDQLDDYTRRCIVRDRSGKGLGQKRKDRLRQLGVTDPAHELTGLGRDVRGLAMRPARRPFDP